MAPPDAPVSPQEHEPPEPSFVSRRPDQTDGARTHPDRHHGRGGRVLSILKRVWVGAYYDGFIHAGNLAYMAILSLFPFFVVVAAIISVLGAQDDGAALLHGFLSGVPPVVAKVIEPVARDVMAARSGWLLWVGGLVGVWTVTSLIETIRDILHRAYRTRATLAFWRYRLLSTALTFGAVVTLMLAFFAQVTITAAQEAIAAWFPEAIAFTPVLSGSRILPAVAIYLSIFTLFATLAPSACRGRRYPKWPGALLVTLWWITVTVALPGVLRVFFRYELTYGSLAGVMIALFFFWLVGLGIVVGAELNAALAEAPDEHDLPGQTKDRNYNRKIAKTTEEDSE